MDLRLFPMDRQVCSIVIQSSAHISKELTYFWRYGNRSKLSFVQGLDYQDRMTPVSINGKKEFLKAFFFQKEDFFFVKSGKVKSIF
jgi:hypothetical protein